MKKSMRIILGTGAVAVVLLSVIGLLVAQRSSQDVRPDNVQTQSSAADFYRGASIRFLIPSEPGGGFDEYVRLLAPYLEHYTGASVKPVNLPGAGGMRAVNELYHSPKNGLTIAIIGGSSMISNQLAGIKGAEYDVEDFEYLGRVVADTRILTVDRDSRYRDMDDILNSSGTVKLGATGLGGSSYVDGVISKEALNLNVRIIHGFDSSSGIRQSMLRGNITGAWGSWGSAEGAVRSGLERVLLQSGRTRIRDLPDVPTGFEFIQRTADPVRARSILNAWNALNAVGRPLATTPGTPAARVQFLREALQKSLHDPGLLTTSEESNRPIDYATGEEVRELIREATHMPEDIETLFIRAIRGEI